MRLEKALTLFMVVLALAAPNSALAAPCGPIPADYPVSSATVLDVKNNVEMNGNPVTSGSTGGNSVIEVDGSRSTVPQTLPDLDPAAFPPNSSSNDVDDRDGPFYSTTARYYDKLEVRDNKYTTLAGGGPFHIEELKVGKDAVVNLTAGIYYINKLHMHGDRARLNVISEPVIIQIGDEINAHAKQVSMNSGGNVAGLRLFLHPGTEIKKTGDDFEFTGLFFGHTTKDTTFGKRAKIRGAAILSHKIKLEDDIEWTYTAGDQALLSQVSTCQPVPHFEIRHDLHGDACEAQPVSLHFHNPFHLVDPSYTSTATLSTSTGNGSWSLLSGSGVLTDLGGGVATYAFAAADNGRVELGLQNGNVETLNIDVTDGTYTEDVFEDADLSFGATKIEFFGDDFGSASYTSNDGALNFSGSWIEVDGAGAGPASGNARINSGELSLDDYTNTNLQTSAERQLDLSFFPWAAVTFDFRTTSSVDVNDSAFFEVSDDGGGSWTVLENFVGMPGGASGTRSYDLTPYMSGNTRIRFRIGDWDGTGGTTCCYGASSEFFLVDNLRVEAPSNARCGADHYSIDHDGSAINCQEEPITITGHDVSHAVEPLITDTIALSTSTSHGDWSLITGAGTLTNSGNGNATYAFDTSDGGVVVLGLSDSFAETLNIDVDDGSVTETASEDADLVFASAGFNFLADAVKNAVGTQIGNKSSDLAPGAQTLELQAIRASDDTGACEAALQGTNTIDMAFECLDPTNCSARQLSVNGLAIAANDAGAPLSYTPVSLDFGDDVDTTAPIVISYPEVGRVRLHARNTLSPSSETLLGASNAFVSRPFGFLLAVSGNPGAASDTGAIYTTAGSDFATTASATLWQGGDDANSDGVPDGHGDADPTNNVNLSDNAIALNYGQEVAPEGVLLSSLLVAPSPGNNPALGGGSTIASFAGGVGSTPNVYWDEVGIIELAGATADGNYLGIGATETARAAGRSGYVGRFTPHDFAVAYNLPLFSTACAAGGFSYLGEDLDYLLDPVITFTAQSRHATPTRNYTGSWFKLSPSDPNGLAYEAGSGTLSASAPNAPNVADLSAGLGTLSFDTGPTLSFVRTTPTAPFDAEISLRVNVRDADGIVFPGNPARFSDTVTGIAFSTAKSIRFGRLVFQNTFGSELAALAVPLRAEYWMGSYFTANTADSCTPAIVPNLALTPVPGALVSTPSMGPALAAGDAGLVLSAPGAGNTGYFDLLFDLTPTGQDRPWLYGDWDGDGNYDDNPIGRATFGVFSGSDQLIYRREIY